MKEKRTFDGRGKEERGFTLIELMVVVLVIGVLAAIAYPAYTNYLVRGRRSSAEGFLMDIAQRQQQYLLDVRSYASDVTTLSMATPSEVSSYYTISMTTAAGPPPTFTATATPLAGTPQASDVTLTINNAGAKTPTGIW